MQISSAGFTLPLRLWRKGNYKPASDIDLTLFGEALTPDLCSAAALALDDLLLPYTIDLSVFDELDHVELREPQRTPSAPKEEQTPNPSLHV